VSDLPFAPAAASIAERLYRAVDAEGKIPRALDALGPLRGRDVVLLDDAPRFGVPQLLRLGARVTVVDRGAGPVAEEPASALVGAAAPGRVADALTVEADAPALVEDAPALTVVRGSPVATGLPEASADAVVALWSAMSGPCPEEVAEADRVLRPGGRLLVLHDYGRDDLEPLRGANASADLVRWSRRDGWYLSNGFRIHVIHAFWTFDSTEEAAAVLRAGFGAAGEVIAGRIHRPRVAHNVAIYHRSRGDGPTAGRPAADRGAGVENGPAATVRGPVAAGAGDVAEAGA